MKTGLKKFKTIIPAGHKFSENLYVRGVITGIELALCSIPNNTKGQPWMEITDDDDNFVKAVMTIMCTEEQYLAFAWDVEKLYPGLVVFDEKVDIYRGGLTS